MMEITKHVRSPKCIYYTCEGLIFLFNGRDLFLVENSTSLTALNFYYPDDGEPEKAIIAFCENSLNQNENDQALGEGQETHAKVPSN